MESSAFSRMEIHGPSKLATRSHVGGPSEAPIVLNGQALDVSSVWRAARCQALVRIDPDPALRRQVDASCTFVADALRNEVPIYGLTTGFGGMANVVVPASEAATLQLSLLRALKVGVGARLSRFDVRAAMLCRANSHLHGGSGIRFELVDRFVRFLNEDVTPHVHEHGSIGASGDLVPLSYIGGCIAGLDGYWVDYKDDVIEARAALLRLGLRPTPLRPKEGLALVNGTSVMTGVAAMCAHDASACLAVAVGAHALLLQALAGTNQSFHPFIHAHKPHRGQRAVATEMLRLLSGSSLSKDELNGSHPTRADEPIQDRYSLRCLPQYLGPIVDGIVTIRSQIDVELNSLTDNPIVDVERSAAYHGGNFLGQYVAVGMDQLRYYLGLVAKHLDAQIALAVTPEFSGGLPASLVGNSAARTNLGLKGLQICGNSIMPLLTFLGAPIADRFPTHAEQYNQNINSQGMVSANQARRSVELMQSYLAIALMFGVQAVDLRCHMRAGHYDATQLLSEPTARLYSAVRSVIGVPPSASRPYVFDDGDQPLDQHISELQADIASHGCIVQALGRLQDALSMRLA
jgi:phenylalanine ammonia-lyase